MYCKKICVNKSTGNTSCQIVSICKLLDDINKKLIGFMDVPLTQQAIINDLVLRSSLVPPAPSVIIFD